MYTERDEVKRAEFDAKLAQIDEKTDIIYVDESGFVKNYYKDKGWALRGKKVFAEKSGKRYARTSLVAGYCKGEVLAMMPYSGTMNKSLFNSWFANMLCSELKIGSVVVLDNATSHSKKSLAKIAKAKGISLLFLPPYSPDKNPIEHLWANIKRFLKTHISKFTDLLTAIFHGYFKVN